MKPDQRDRPEIFTTDIADSTGKAGLISVPSIHYP
jgi:hypothetical protein